MIKADAAVAVGDAVVAILAVALLRQETTAGAEPWIPISFVVGDPGLSCRSIGDQMLGGYDLVMAQRRNWERKRGCCDEPRDEMLAAPSHS